MLTLEQVKRARELLGTGLSHREIAIRIGISRQSIAQIVKGLMPCELAKDVEPGNCELCGKELPCITCAKELAQKNPNRGELPEDEVEIILGGTNLMNKYYTIGGRDARVY